MASWGDYAVKAAYVIENTFPPQELDDTYCLVVALNLLNAIVKQPGGRRLTSYSYIKGMAACLFLWLMYHPQRAVRVFWDKADDVAYFRICGRQFSFHYVPLLHCYAAEMVQLGLQAQLWDGVRLQEVATGLFDAACSGLPPLGIDECRRLTDLMTHFSWDSLKERVGAMEGVEQMPWKQACHGCAGSGMPRGEKEKWYNLKQALLFDGFDRDCYELRRHKDCWKAKVVRYQGDNYAAMVELLSPGKPQWCRMPERLLEKGAWYYVQRTNWMWKKLSCKRALLLRAHYCNLVKKRKSYNLCVTYRIACYLALCFPDIRFVNVLNYTRFRVRRRTYTYRDLLRVPAGSKARVLKVWMVVDQHHDLRHFDVNSIPARLFREYQEADDYADFFCKVFKNGRVGLVAYSRFHLLPAVYDRVEVYGHYARVRNHDGKWAIYSLLQECFVTDFDYDAIWYDHASYAILGTVQKRIVVIHQMGTGRKQGEMTEIEDC